MNFSLSSRLVRPRAADRNQQEAETSPLFHVPPAGGSRGSERRDEEQLPLAAHVTGGCTFGSESAREQSERLVCAGGSSGSQKITNLEPFVEEGGK